MQKTEMLKEKNLLKTKASTAHPYGTKEWSDHSVNCCTGCAHNCLYCYAREMAVRFGRVEYDNWCDEHIRQWDVDKRYGRMSGHVMFPTSHDITPTNLDACLVVLEKLLAAGNEVLVVSKPRVECMEPIFELCMPYQNHLLFRFTITAADDAILSVWEPGAPCFRERLDCLSKAFQAGFKTSVSVEPMLDPANIEALVQLVAPFVNDKIWIGKLNGIKRRVRSKSLQVARAVRDIESGQTDEKILGIHGRLESHPKVVWKGSITEIVKHYLPEDHGLAK